MNITINNETLNIEIGDIFKRYDHKGNFEEWKITGFQTWDNGKTGIEAVRFIQSRIDWAKTPKSWIAIEQIEAGKDMQACAIEFPRLNVTVKA